MFSKATLALAVAIVLGTAFPALAATKHHYRVTNRIDYGFSADIAASPGTILNDELLAEPQ